MLARRRQIDGGSGIFFFVGSVGSVVSLDRHQVAGGFWTIYGSDSIVSNGLFGIKKETLKSAQVGCAMLRLDSLDFRFERTVTVISASRDFAKRKFRLPSDH